MGKLRQLSPELLPLIDVILFSYIELIFRGGVSCLPAALLFTVCLHNWTEFIITLKHLQQADQRKIIAHLSRAQSAKMCFFRELMEIT